MINETLARQAHDGMSMTSYKAGSATAEWKAMCADARKAADDAIKRAPHREDEIEALYDRYERKAADYINEGNRIGAMCPSVLVTGAGNFPTRKKSKQLAAYDNFYKKDWGFDELLRKIKIIGTDREPIMSGDADAIERLEKKLADRTAAQDAMKKANAWYRKHKTMEGFEPESIRKLADGNISYERDNMYIPSGADPDEYRAKYMESVRPFASWQLSNNNAEIRRLKERLEGLKAAKEAPAAEEREITVCGEPCTVVENTEIMRLQLLFDGKPGADCRAELKRNGFRWAPSQGAWQRQLTNNARAALRCLAA